LLFIVRTIKAHGHILRAKHWNFSVQASGTCDCHSVLKFWIMCRNPLDVIWTQLIDCGSTEIWTLFEHVSAVEQAMFRFLLHAVVHPYRPGVFYVVGVLSMCGMVFKLGLFFRGILIGWNQTALRKCLRDKNVNKEAGSNLSVLLVIEIRSQTCNF
jgi:hypothetical protein